MCSLFTVRSWFLVWWVYLDWNLCILDFCLRSQILFGMVPLPALVATSLVGSNPLKLMSIGENLPLHQVSSDNTEQGEDLVTIWWGGNYGLCMGSLLTKNGAKGSLPNGLSDSTSLEQEFIGLQQSLIGLKLRLPTWPFMAWIRWPLPLKVFA